MKKQPAPGDTILFPNEDIRMQSVALWTLLTVLRASHMRRPGMHFRRRRGERRPLRTRNTRRREYHRAGPPRKWGVYLEMEELEMDNALGQS